MKYFLLVISILTVSISGLQAQKKAYKVAAVGFYNLENLFDTLDTPDVRDTEFTPEGPNRYNTRIYTEKLDHLSEVVAELGTELTPDGLAILGVAEVENKKVLEDFVVQPRIKDRNYQIVHYDSPDRRGIDVGLLYQPKYFTVTHSKNLPLMIYKDNGDRIYTRDVLYVAGEFDEEPLHIFVNHWPSRRGGEAATQPLRNAGAMLCKKYADSIQQENPGAKIIIMGDLNDDPTSPSVKTILNAKRKKESVKKSGYYNPMYDPFKKGMGTLAYRDAWSLFDQLIFSHGLIDKKADGFKFYTVQIHNKKELLQKTGQFKGYPHRTFAGNNYLGGYSDHFPVYAYLIKEVDGEDNR